MNKMTKKELLSLCNALKIENCKTKKKEEIIELINGKSYKTDNIATNKKVLIELLLTVPKDKKRKVCKNCNELGHGIRSNKCRENIIKKNILKNRIEDCVLSNDVFDKNLDEVLTNISDELKISQNMCNRIYQEIDTTQLLERKINFDKYEEIINGFKINCHDCNKVLINIQSDTNRVWKENIICDSCWCNYEEEREHNWKKIREYKQIICCICDNVKTKEGQRFHYDHLNMFEKYDSVKMMVNKGIDIEDICNEIDKCQVLCLQCHHIVTDIERNIGFTRIKQNLTRQFNSGEMTLEEYEIEKQKYNDIYKNKMVNIYEQLRNNFLPT